MGKLKHIIAIYGLLFALIAGMVFHAILSIYRSGPVMDGKKELAGLLGLTDLCLTTEARYTRHPSQADYFTPFQDNPGSLDLFPSGGAMAPPSFKGIPRKMAIRR